jgi:NitT/TauT family transport system substrate-binding protein
MTKAGSLPATTDNWGKKMTHRLTLKGMAAVAAWILSQSFAYAEDQLKVAVGQRGAWETSITELGQKAGFYKKHGLNLDVLYTQGGGETQQAVISGSTDLGTAVGTFGALAAYAKGAPIRGIGATQSGANDLLWYVRADSPIKSMKDTAGKTVAYSTNGSSTHQAVLAFRKHYNVDFQAVATGSPAATFTQLMSGQVDVGWAVVPFAVQAADEGKVRIIAKAGDLPTFQNQTARLIVTNADALRNRRDALARYVQGYRETLNWMYTDPAALKAYAEFAQVPESVAKRVRDDLIPRNDLDPDRLVGLDAVMADAVTFKYLTAPLSKEQLSEALIIPFK